MNSSPVQYRFLMRKFTLEDARNGIQPIKQQTGPYVNGVCAFDVFAPPLFQSRHKEKVYIDSKPTMQWTEWETAPIVLEGHEPVDEPAP